MNTTQKIINTRLTIERMYKDAKNHHEPQIAQIRTQALRDALEAMKQNKLITTYNLNTQTPPTTHSPQ